MRFEIQDEYSDKVSAFVCEHDYGNYNTRSPYLHDVRFDSYATSGTTINDQNRGKTFDFNAYNWQEDHWLNVKPTATTPDELLMSGIAIFKYGKTDLVFTYCNGARYFSKGND